MGCRDYSAIALQASNPQRLAIALISDYVVVRRSSFSSLLFNWLLFCRFISPFQLSPLLWIAMSRSRTHAIPIHIMVNRNALSKGSRLYTKARTES
jgi:hypothetical protein